jgi:RND family efflux transporter MFP subunit
VTRSSLLCLLSLLFFFLGSGCHRGNTPRSTARSPIPVLVRPVQDPSDTREARYSGTVEPATRVDVAFKVGGYVRELLEVKDLDGRPRKVQEGDLISAGTILAVVREGDYREKLAAANAQVAQAAASQSQAQLDYDRSKRLVASNAVAPSELDTMTSKLASARAVVESAQAQARDAKLLLDDATLRAPIDGVILKRAVEAGTLVSAGTLGFTIADTKSVKFVFGAPDVLLEKLTLGARLAVHVDALDGDVDGTITRIAPSADPKSRVFEIEVTIPNPDGRLKPGLVASLEVPGQTPRASVIVLPLTGVVRSLQDRRGFAVYVVTEENGETVAHVRDVTLGAVIGNEVQVLGGLKKGDRIVSMGAPLLVDGVRVRILPS